MSSYRNIKLDNNVINLKKKNIKQRETKNARIKSKDFTTKL